jgi:hypothetical protein
MLAVSKTNRELKRSRYLETFFCIQFSSSLRLLILLPSNNKGIIKEATWD